MKVCYYDSLETYIKSTRFKKWQANVIRIIREGSWVLADAGIVDGDCYKLVKDFFKALSIYPGYDGWESKIVKKLENGITFGDDRKSDNTFAWAVITTENSVHIVLNIKAY